MFVHPFCHSPYRDFGSFPIREPKDSGGNTAEGNASDIIFQAQVQRVFIAVRQILFQIFCQLPGDDGADNMDHFLRGKIVTVRQHRNGCRLFIIRTVFCPQFIHLLIALSPQLYTGIGVDAVINAGMHGNETAQHLGIGRVHDGIGRKSCNIALPDGD